VIDRWFTIHTGATPFGYHVAAIPAFPIAQAQTRLVPLSFAPDDWKPYADLKTASLMCGEFRQHSVPRKTCWSPSRSERSGNIANLFLLAARPAAAYQPATGLRHGDLLDEQKTSKKLFSNY